MTRRLRVLHSAHRFGALTQTWLANQLRNPHVDHAMLAASIDGEPVFGDATVLAESAAPHLARSFDRRIGGRRELSAVHLWALAATRPDLVHFHFGDRAWDGWRSPHLLRTPFVVSFYGVDASLRPRQEPAWLSRYARYFRHAAAIVAEGPAMRRRLLELGAPPDRTHVVRIGVDLEQLAFAPRRRAAREPLRILMAGRFVQKKGFPIGIEAVGRLLEKHPDSVDRLTLVGGPGGTVRAEAEARAIDDAAARWLPGPQLVRPGFIDQSALLALAREHDVLLVPSREADDGDSEGGSPVVATELGGAGLVVVSSDHADLPQLVLHDQTGLCVPERDPRAIADALHRLWRTRTVGPRLARGMREHVETSFDLAAMHRQMTDVYERVARR